MMADTLMSVTCTYSELVAELCERFCGRNALPSLSLVSNPGCKRRHGLGSRGRILQFSARPLFSRTSIMSRRSILVLLQAIAFTGVKCSVATEGMQRKPTHEASPTVTDLATILHEFTTAQDSEDFASTDAHEWNNNRTAVADHVGSALLRPASLPTNVEGLDEHEA